MSGAQGGYFKGNSGQIRSGFSRCNSGTFALSIEVKPGPEVNVNIGIE